MARRDLDPPDELLHKDHFVPEELADLLEMDLSLIRHAAFVGELPAQIVEHHILNIRRVDVLQWLEQRRGESGIPIAESIPMAP